MTSVEQRESSARSSEGLAVVAGLGIAVAAILATHSRVHPDDGSSQRCSSRPCS